MTPERLRIAASLLCIVAYALVVRGFVLPGTALNLLTNLLFAPFLWRQRLWDMLLIELVYGAINVDALIR